MADYSSNTGSSGAGAPKTRGYQAARRQDRDRREKRKELLNNGSSKQTEADPPRTPKSESSFEHKETTVKHSEKTSYRSSARSNESYESGDRFSSSKSKQHYKDAPRHQNSSRDTRDVKSRDGKDREYKETRDKDRRSYDYKEARKSDRDSKEKRAPAGESIFKFKKDISGKNDSAKSPPKKQADTETNA